MDQATFDVHFLRAIAEQIVYGRSDVLMGISGQVGTLRGCGRCRLAYGRAGDGRRLAVRR